ncbi:MAG: 50S ribosome-binding GTPase [Pseudanabaena sp. Salubria-1]|nr:50S ribosome-binding GTPase [Pseudanabaena sp. Salubria-1]
MKFEPPSISSIRAKFLIEKLNEFSNNFTSINLCATGRTGSGKTTLGNRLIGVDYFMPSSGEQDCTDEVNLVEFSNGLKYFDLPGVASKGQLENYNRAALGIEQRGKLQKVDDLILSQYSIGSEPRKNTFTVSEFKHRQILEPDLILYLIAPDKQFLDVDCLYLGDLLSQYSQIIYVFNVFADKQTGTIYATEQNIKDVATRIKEVHNFVLGEDNQPIIIPVSCWTGEGISDLVLHSCEVLGNEKGELFKKLISYQQQKTPDEYVHQVKKMLNDIFAYASCQKPEDSYTCDQSIHEACYNFLEFLVDLKFQSSNLSNQTHSWIKRTIFETLSSKVQELDQSLSASLDEEISFLHDGFDSIQNGIDLLNQLINVNLASTSTKAIETRDRETIEFASDIESCQEEINILESQFNAELERYKSIEDEITAIAKQLEDNQQKRNVLIDEFNSLNSQIGTRIDGHNASANSVRVFISDLDSRIDRYNFRREKLNVRISAFNSTFERLKSSSNRVSESAISSLRSESESIEREEDSLKSESRYLDGLINQRSQKISSLESDENSIQRMITKRDEIKRDIDSEEKKIDNKRSQGIQKLKLRESIQESLQISIKGLSEKYKIRQDTIEFGRATLDSFNNDLEIIGSKIDSRIEDINTRLTQIRTEYADFLESEYVSLEQISPLRERINSCLEEMQSFNDEIAFFQRDLEICTYKVSTNKLITDAIRQCTTHHFDSTGEFEYKGSTYHYFNEKGLSILLSLVYFVNQDGDEDFTSSSMSANISKLVSNVGYFPTNSSLGQITSWLEPRIEKLLPTSFDEMLKSLVL